jgi:hypothetical protein
MTDRDRLIELLTEFYGVDPMYYGVDANGIADHFLSNGVIVPPCKVGDNVYILEEKCKYSGEKNEPWNSCNQYWDNVFKNGMWGCAGKDKMGNKIYCNQKEMVWYTKEVEYSLSLYSNPTKVLGENLFLTKEDAEEKLKELGK